MNSRWWHGAAAPAVLLMFAVLVVSCAEEGSSRGEVAGGAPVTPIATRTSAPPAAPTPTSTPAAPTREFIPGLTAVDITGNVEPRGLRCDGPRTEPGGISYFCSGGGLSVSVAGASPTRIRAVSAVAVGWDDGQAAAFLGFIATVPYEGAQPNAARSWVEANVSAGATRTFGGARYTLSGPDLGRSLDIAALDR